MIDADTIEIHGTRIRLQGIDAPETRQLCEVNGEAYRCGQRAAFALSDLLGSRTVQCAQTDVDRWGRSIARCSVAGQDLGGWMVEKGWAIAYRRYSKEYVPEEHQARSQHRGIWAGSFEEPERWRREHH